MLGISLATSDESSRSKSPSSLYPTIIDGSVGDHTLGLRYGNKNDVLQRSSDKTDKTIVYSHELEPSPGLSLSKLSCNLEERSSGSTDRANKVPVLSRMSSFYQEALKEASLVEEDLAFQQQKPQEDFSREDRRYSEEKDDNYAPDFCTLTRLTNSFHTPESNGTGTYVSTPISPFHRTALEDAALVEERLSMLQKQQHERKQQYKRAANIFHANGVDEVVNRSIYLPSSFYRSALNEAMISEQELGVQGETEDNKDHDVVPATESDNVSSMQQRPNATLVLESQFHSNSAIEPTDIRRDEDKNGARRSAMSPFSSSTPSSYPVASSSPPMTSSTAFDRATATDPNLSSSASSDVVANEMEIITPDRRSQSFVDDSCSVTRSLAMSHVRSQVLPATQGGAEVGARRSNDCLFAGKDVLHGSKPQDTVNEENDEDLRLAIYLSRVESSAASSLNSERTFCDSLSTGESRSAQDQESKSDHFNDHFLTSRGSNKDDSEFMISQFKAMQEYQRNNKTYCSPTKPTSDENIFRSSNDIATISTPSPRQQRRRRTRLETRGALETRQAISNGSSHVVKCKGCNGRLQAPLSYSLVFCPKCQTVSPA